MIKLNCGINRKIGEPGYGSRGASVNVELELESSAAQDVQLLHDKIRRLFSLAKSAVDEELGVNGKPGSQTPAAAQPPAPPSRNGSSPRPATNGNANGSQPPRPATEAQMRAVRGMCAKLGLDPQAEVGARFNHSLDEITLPEASTFIDDLKKRVGNGQ